MRYLGIDFGTKRIGLALSDEGGTMGFPYGTIPNDKKVFGAITDLITKEKVEAVVIGESKNFQGEANAVDKEAKMFAMNLREGGVQVYFEPELFTTQEARLMPDGTRTYGNVDSSAAALILTSYLSHK